MQRQLLCAALFAAGLLSACGGGGSSPVVETTASVSLNGVASKGLMAGALVTAHAVNADGSIDGTALAGPVETGANGSYTLSFTATKDKPYVIRVAAKADGSTTHLDELTGTAQALPAGFTMRTLFIPTTTGALSTSASVTPFSEMTVAAAQRATGGLTAANAAQAIQVISTLLGFNPTTVTPTSVASASGPAQQQMAVLLTAVSQLANSGGLGCTTGSDGAKVQCVVEALAESVKTDSIKLATPATGADVSGALAAAVTTVLTTPSLSGTVSPATLTTVLANLACTTSCAVASGGTTTSPTPPSATALAIAAAKLLFTEVKSDFTAMFSRRSAAEPAAVNNQVLKFQTAMKGVQVPAVTLVKDLGALLMGIDLYHDFKSGRDTLNSRSRAPDSVASDDGSMLNSVGCSLYTDNTTTVLATTPAQVGAIGCTANYYVATVSGVFTRWRHGFTIVPNADGTFGYTTRARQSTATTNVALSAPFAGTLTPTLDVPDGRIVGFAVTGDLAPSFKLDTNVLANNHQSWSMQGTRSISGFKQEIATLAGNVVSYSDATTVAGTLTVKSGQSTEMPVTADGSKPSAAQPATQGAIATLSLNLVWATPGAEFEGVLAATDSVWDQSLGYHLPSKLTLSGALRNIDAGVSTEFIKGVFTATLSGYENYNANSVAADSASNFYTVGGSFVGTVTAPNRPKLEITVGTSNKSHEAVGDLTMQYRSFVNGSPRLVIGVSAVRQVDGSSFITLTEATSGLSLSLAPGASTAPLVRGGGEVVGTLDRNSLLLTFSDGSFVSLDLGL